MLVLGLKLRNIGLHVLRLLPYINQIKIIDFESTRMHVESTRMRVESTRMYVESTRMRVNFTSKRVIFTRLRV
jgi:hypothetical protein